MLYIIVNCYYEEEVVVNTITHSLLKILWVSGDRDEGSKRAHTGVSDCNARQSLTCRYSFLGKKKKQKTKRNIFNSLLGYQNRSLGMKNVLLLCCSNVLREWYVLK